MRHDPVLVRLKLSDGDVEDAFGSVDGLIVPVVETDYFEESTRFGAADGRTIVYLRRHVVWILRTPVEPPPDGLCCDLNQSTMGRHHSRFCPKPCEVKAS